MASTTEAMLASEEKWVRQGMFVNDPNWVLEQKCDGDRLLVIVDYSGVSVLNRKGDLKTTGSFNVFLPAFHQFIGTGEWTFDGELVGNEYFLFDMIDAANIPVSTPWVTRRRALERMFERITAQDHTGRIHLLHTARTEREKRYLIDAVVASGGEGVIAKEREAPYEPGRRSKSVRKLKRVHDVDCVVKQKNVGGKENAILGVFDTVPATVDTNGRFLHGRAVVPTARDVGKCSLLNKPPVEVGDIVEVRYLYVGSNGRLFQPRLMRVRTDKGYHECLTSQLEGTEVNKDVLRSFPVA